MYPSKQQLALSLVLGLGCQTGMAQGTAGKALLEQGLYWQAQGNNERAAESWKKLLRLQPDETRALYGLAQVEINQKRSAGAVDILTRLRALDAKGPYTLLLAQDITLKTGDGPKTLDKARLLHESGEIEKSVEQYQQALGGSEPMGDIGVEYYRVVSKLPNGWKTARSGFERLAKASPSDAQIELHLAFLLARGEEPRWETRPEGIERLARVAAVPAVSGFATESWKMALGWLGVTKQETLGLFDAYLKRHPDDSEVTELRASAVRKLQAQAKAAEPHPQIAAGLKALSQGDLQKAEIEYLARIKASPKDPDALGGLGLVRMQQNRWEESQALLLRATQQKNGNNWSKALQAARYQWLVDQGTNAQREGDLLQARSLLQQAITLDPTQNSALLGLASLQFDAGELQAAEKNYRQILARSAADVDALRGLAGLLASSDKLDEARSLVERLTPAQVGGVDELNRLRATLASGQVKAALRLGDVALAQATLERAMAQDRSNPWIRWDLADLYAKQGRLSEARGLIDGLLASQPDNPVALFASASFAAGRGQWRSALAALERIATQDRTADIATLQKRSWLQHQAALAVSLARQGRQPEALALLDQAEPLTAGHRDLLGVLAEAYVDAGAPAHGLGLLRDLMSRSGQPAAVDSLQYASLLLKTQQDVECGGVLRDLAGRTLSTADRQRLDDLMYHHTLRQVDLLRERGDLAASRELLAPVLDKRPNDPLADAVLARLTASAGDKRGALELARKLVAKHPDNVNIQLSAAMLATRFKDTDLATTALQSALALGRDDAEVLAGAARLYRELGKSAQAGQLFERAIALQNAPAPGHQAVLAASSGARSNSADLLDARAEPAELLAAALRTPPTAPDDYWRSAQAQARPMSEATTLAAVAPRTGPTMRAELDEIRAARSPELRVAAHTRKRNGKSGSSQLQQTEVPLELQLPVGDGKLMLRLNQLTLNAGEPSAGSTMTQKASGLAAAVGYTGKGLAADIGQTPAGFIQKNITGGIRLEGALVDDGSLSYRMNVSSRPVTDSLLSFAGARDSATGKTWGGVMASGARLELSKELGGYGVYGAGAWHQLRGHEVASNQRSELGLGGYFDLQRSTDHQLSSGLNLSVLAYRKNLGGFDIGQGGYFSPQRYTALTVPLNWAQRSGALSFLMQGALGYQKFSQDLPAASATPGVQDSSGLSYKLAASAQYQFSPHWLVDASLNSDNSASSSYRQWAAGLTLRYSWNAGSPTLALPTSGLVSPFGQ